MVFLLCYFAFISESTSSRCACRLAVLRGLMRELMTCVCFSSRCHIVHTAEEVHGSAPNLMDALCCATSRLCQLVRHTRNPNGSYCLISVAHIGNDRTEKAKADARMAGAPVVRLFPSPAPYIRFIIRTSRSQLNSGCSRSLCLVCDTAY